MSDKKQETIADIIAERAAMAGKPVIVGMPVSRDESAAPAMPQNMPYPQPQVSAQRNTGMCIGRNTAPTPSA